MADMRRTDTTAGTRGRGRRQRRVAVAGVALALGAAGVLTGGVVHPSAASAGPVAHAGLSISLTWQQTLPDAGSPIAQSSPSVATLDRSGPSVVVGDRAGNIWDFHLA